MPLQILYDMRAQKPQHFSFDARDTTPYYVTNFFVAFFVYVAFTCAVLFVIFTAIWTIIGFEPIWLAVRPTVLFIGVMYVMSKVYGTLLVMKIFFNRFLESPADGAILRHPNVFHAVELGVSASIIFDGFFKGVEQLLFQFTFLFNSLLRIDRSRLPRGFETYDAGFSGIMGCMLLFEQHCSPIVTEFLDGICVEGPLRGVSHLRRLVDKGGSEHLRPKLEAAEASLAKKQRVLATIQGDTGLDLSALSHGQQGEVPVRDYAESSDAVEMDLWNTEEPDAVDVFTEQDAANLRPFCAARNRWRLALLLIQNPSLMKYRKFRLPHPGGDNARAKPADLEQGKDNEATFATDPREELVPHPREGAGEAMPAPTMGGHSNTADTADDTVNKRPSVSGKSSSNKEIQKAAVLAV